MAEWLKAAVLKTVVLGRAPGVRIPLPPFLNSHLWEVSLRAFAVLIEAVIILASHIFLKNRDYQVFFSEIYLQENP